jgi:hypothetical protein
MLIQERIEHKDPELTPELTPPETLFPGVTEEDIKPVREPSTQTTTSLEGLAEVTPHPTYVPAIVKLQSDPHYEEYMNLLWNELVGEPGIETFGVNVDPDAMRLFLEAHPQFNAIKHDIFQDLEFVDLKDEDYPSAWKALYRYIHQITPETVFPRYQVTEDKDTGVALTIGESARSDRTAPSFLESPFIDPDVPSWKQWKRDLDDLLAR